jgi:ABC-type lipoprotein export system ATPase subunit
MLKAIKIKGLFGSFDYDIELKDEGITILTGPNGYGKSTILKSVYALASRNPFFFIDLYFSEMLLEFNDRLPVKIFKKNQDVEIVDGDKPPVVLNFDRITDELEQNLKNSNYKRIGGDRWIDRRTDRIIDTEMLVSRVGAEECALGEIFPDVPDVYLITDQRLFRKTSGEGRLILSNDNQDVDHFKEAIWEYVKDLGNQITNTLAEATKVSQSLDSSFPKRLFSQKKGVDKEEFDRRFSRIKRVQSALNRYGLAVSVVDDEPVYSQENAKALKVYLDDTEKKLKVFEPLLMRLELLIEILNKRGFVNKEAVVKGQKGLCFRTKEGRSLKLKRLSSGEQQEVVMIYELLFNVKPDTLVMVDEPEISLHVAWQKQFIEDLLRIASMQRINVIVATHSPQIINNRWDLTIDLEDISE